MLLLAVFLQCPRSIVPDLEIFNHLCFALVDEVDLALVEVEDLHALGPIGDVDQVIAV